MTNRPSWYLLFHPTKYRSERISILSSPELSWSDSSVESSTWCSRPSCINKPCVLVAGAPCLEQQPLWQWCELSFRSYRLWRVASCLSHQVPPNDVWSLVSPESYLSTSLQFCFASLKAACNILQTWQHRSSTHASCDTCQHFVRELYYHLQLKLCQHSVSYTHLTLPTIYSV